jgi:FkbM family methyltransferase
VLPSTLSAEQLWDAFSKHGVHVNWRTPVKLARLLVQVKNPWPLIRDRLGLQRAPYVLHFRNGLKQELRPGRGDLVAFRESWLQRDYLPSGRQLAEGMTVIDVGANIGCFTLFAAGQVGRAGRVVAVEPDAETFGQLQRNVAINSLENVEFLRAAVAGHSGVGQLHHHPNALFSSLYASVDGRSDAGGAEEVPAVTLAQVFDEQRIERCHFLKLDCEGAEHAIVRGLTAELAARIDQIGMEVHEIEGCDRRDLVRRLEEFGFTAHARGALVFFSRRSQ